MTTLLCGGNTRITVLFRKGLWCMVHDASIMTSIIARATPPPRRDIRCDTTVKHNGKPRWLEMSRAYGHLRIRSGKRSMANGRQGLQEDCKIKSTTILLYVDCGDLSAVRISANGVVSALNPTLRSSVEWKRDKLTKGVGAPPPEGE